MDRILAKVFRGKNVLVTGHTGFKGSWLCIWLIMLGAKVIGYALDPAKREDNFVVTGLKDKMRDIRADVRDLMALQKTFAEVRPEFVFHLAAQPLVRYSYENPVGTYATNVMGTLNVLECIRHSDVTRVGVMVTTDKCYENKEQIWGYRENDALGGYDPYSASKGCAEILTASYRNSYMNSKEYSRHGKSIATARAGNVIGGGDWALDRIMPDVIRALNEERPVEVRNPGATRPWQHVLEPLGGYLSLAAKMYDHGEDYSGAWNFGPDFDSVCPVKTVVEAVIDAWGSGTWCSVGQENSLHEAGLLSLDCTKAKTLLGWKPKLKLKDAIAYTVEWYQSTEDKYELCENQIERYESELRSR
jgi:CDP-glucose 4,6-dehydratase